MNLASRGCSLSRSSQLVHGTDSGKFFQRGWCRFGYDSVLAEWVNQILPVARATVADPKNKKWLRCGGTWFAGVNVLPNDERGAVKGGTPIGGKAIEFIATKLKLSGVSWDKAQISVCYPGYPKPDPLESSAAYRYRQRHDAAHIDGLLPVGSKRRRYLREYHAFYPRYSVGGV